MRLIPEEVLLDLLERSVRLMSGLLPLLKESGARPAPEALQEGFRSLLRDLHAQKRNESVLCDETWEWIWKTEPGMSSLRLYGRLAWINYTLLDLL